MKSRLVLILATFFMGMGLFSQNMRNAYQKQWQEVDKLSSESLPKSAIDKTEAILQQAIADKNIPQVMKSYIFLYQLNSTIDTNNDFDYIGKLEMLLNDAQQPTDKALIHSILADLYSQTYMDDRWNISQRTDLPQEVIPVDIKEWTTSNYLNKIFEHLQAAIEDKEALLEDTTKSYDDIIKLGEDSRTYRPTLYDFVMNRTIESAKSLQQIGNQEFDLAAIGATLEQLTLPAHQYVKQSITPSKKYIVYSYYQQYLSDLLNRGLTGALILAELDKFDFVRSHAYSLDSSKSLQVLYTLEKLYRDDETTVEIINSIVDNLNVDWRIGLRGMPLAGGEDSDGIQRQNKEMYDWLQKGIEKYPNYKRIGILKNRLASLEEPFMKIEGGDLFYPEDKIEIDLIYRNSQKVRKSKQVRLFAIRGGKEVLLRTIGVDFKSRETYETDTTKLSLGSLPMGEYCLKTNFKEAEYSDQKFDFSVSNLMTYYRSSSQNEYEIFVVDRKNGKPIEGATVTVSVGKEAKDKKTLAQLTTNELGMVVFSDSVKVQEFNRYPEYKVSYQNDKGLKQQVMYATSYYRGYNYQPDVKQPDAISVFADRSIYRPGQTICFKAIVLDGSSKVVANSKRTVRLYNPNREVVGEVVLSTNQYGSISDKFVLPQRGLTGYYQIEVDGGGRLGLRVEEYKRPSFEVKFEKIDKTFSFGDEVVLKGSALAYSGVSLQDAEVNYRISRRPFSFWPWRGAGESHFQSGVVKTKADGTFEIEFIPQLGDGHNMLGGNVYTFSITADVTDLNGETRNAEYSVNIGDVSMMLDVDLASQIEKSEATPFTIQARNLAGVEVTASGGYEVYALDKSNKVGAKLQEGKFTTGKQEQLIGEIKKLASGRYRIILKAKDDAGREVQAEKDFVLFGYDDPKPPYETDIWLVEKSKQFAEGKPAQIIYGTSNSDTYVLYQVYNNQKTFERRFVKLDNQNHKFEIPYLSDYGDEVYVSFTTVRNRELKTNSVLLNKEQPKADTELTLKMGTFRDKLRPGQAETWTLSVYDSANNPVSAEVLASMYDASLDQIYPLEAWMLNRPHVYKEYLRELSFNFSSGFRNSYFFNFDNEGDVQKYVRFDFDEFKYGLSRRYPIYDLKEESMAGGAPMLNRPVVRMSKSDISSRDQISIADVAENDASGIDINELSEQKVVVEESAVDSGSENGASGSEPQVRRNFNETAFFYPQLKLNESGETVISFTAPESNTQWRFRALAHDKDSKVGQLEKMVYTRKELMVTPNMPRFLRHGDRASISTKISNLSESSVSGQVGIEFFNPIDDKKVNLKVKEGKQKFALGKDASTFATWTFDVPADVDLLGVRIVATSGKFSDGEQHALVVLPNRLLVTEAMPFDVTEVGEETFVFEKMEDNKSKTLENNKLTLEFASNPAWYAVQALPVMSNPTNENAVNWFASYYVNRLGASLMRQYPKVANVMEAWIKQGGDKEVLISKLSKNEELKTILLEETPWVLDAQSETEQMQRLALLFDLNNSKNQSDIALQKLKELQTGDGPWTWYKGMYPSRSITQYLLYGFAELQRVAQVEYPEDVKVMQMNGLRYVDKQIVEDFNNLKKYNRNWKEIKSITTSQLEYLYLRAMYRDIPISHEAREAERFYTEVVCNNWTGISLYEKSLLAVLSKELGKKDLAAKIVKSIKEHSLEDKEMGMYWPNNKNHVFLSMSAVSTHVFVMEALKENGATAAEMDLMKRWLVKQKQTQVWESTHATIDAIGALLGNGSDWFGVDNEPVIKVGGKIVRSSSGETITDMWQGCMPVNVSLILGWKNLLR